MVVLARIGMVRPAQGRHPADAGQGACQRDGSADGHGGEGRAKDDWHLQAPLWRWVWGESVLQSEKEGARENEEDNHGPTNG